MKKASIAEVEKGLSDLIDDLWSGGSVLIVDGGLPVARLEPVSNEPAVLKDDRLMRLVRKGIVRPARFPLPKSLLSTRPPSVKSGVSVLSALLEERHQDR